jgi:hypothetical protein
MARDIGSMHNPNIGIYNMAIHTKVQRRNTVGRKYCSRKIEKCNSHVWKVEHSIRATKKKKKKKKKKKNRTGGRGGPHPSVCIYVIRTADGGYPINQSINQPINQEYKKIESEPGNTFQKRRPNHSMSGCKNDNTQREATPATEQLLRVRTTKI